MSKDEAIKQLNAITEDGDKESDHGTADSVLLEYLRASGGQEVADAFERARERAGFWYA